MGLVESKKERKFRKNFFDNIFVFFEYFEFLSEHLCVLWVSLNFFENIFVFFEFLWISLRTSLCSLSTLKEITYLCFPLFCPHFLFCVNTSETSSDGSLLTKRKGNNHGKFLMRLFRQLDPRKDFRQMPSDQAADYFAIIHLSKCTGVTIIWAKDEILLEGKLGFSLFWGPAPFKIPMRVFNTVI